MLSLSVLLKLNWVLPQFTPATLVFSVSDSIYVLVPVMDSCK